MSDEASAVAEPQPLKIDVNVEETSTCQRKVKVSIPREEIDRYHEEAVGDLMPTALLPGFRPGRAPRRLVGSRFKTGYRVTVKKK